MQAVQATCSLLLDCSNDGRGLCPLTVILLESYCATEHHEENSLECLTYIIYQKKTVMR